MAKEVLLETIQAMREEHQEIQEIDKTKKETLALDESFKG